MRFSFVPRTSCPPNHTERLKPRGSRDKSVATLRWIGHLFLAVAAAAGSERRQRAGITAGQQEHSPVVLAAEKRAAVDFPPYSRHRTCLGPLPERKVTIVIAGIWFGGDRPQP